MKIVAHRGNHDHNFAPENTIEAINHAWALNIYGVEVDVQLTSDMQIVVFHDYQTGRLTDYNLSVCNSKLEELRKLSVVGEDRKYPPFKYRIPLLKEVLLTIPQDRVLFIEIKHHGNCEDKIIDILYNLLEQYNISSKQIVLIGFINNCAEFAKMKKVKEKFKSYRVFPIFNFININNSEEIIEKAVLMEADGVSIGSSYIEIFNYFIEKHEPVKNFMEKFYRYDLPVNVWALDDPVMAGILFAAGVSTITTNKPVLLSAHFKSNLLNGA